MARPRKAKDSVREVRLNLRLTLEERAQLEAKASAALLSPSDFARQAALGARIEAARATASGGGLAEPLAPKAKTPDGIEHVVALNRIGVNLNQIARTLNAGLGLVPAELDNCLARVNQLLDDWQGVST